MSAVVVPYEEKYKEGVIACFRRNYSEMTHLSEEKLAAWAEPMFSYSWQDMPTSEEVPYKYGVVILDEGNVVGYLGFIYSKRPANGKTWLCANCTTWAIDKGYRIYMFSAIKKAIKNVDIVLDLSAIGKVRETLIKVFKFKIFEENIREFPPIPVLRNMIKLRDIKQTADIMDSVVRNEFIDHMPYPLYCVKAEKGGDSCYLFYKIKKRVKTKYFGHQKCIEILSISDRDFFSQHAHEIIWLLQKKEQAHLRCDSHFFNDHLLRYHGYAVHTGKRLLLNKTKQAFPVDYLYSEFAMLGNINE